jgi:hypothetical protein
VNGTRVWAEAKAKTVGLARGRHFRVLNPDSMAASLFQGEPPSRCESLDQRQGTDVQGGVGFADGRRKAGHGHDWIFSSDGLDWPNNINPLRDIPNFPAVSKIPIIQDWGTMFQRQSGDYVSHLPETEGT